jgi:hypothetical protein
VIAAAAAVLIPATSGSAAATGPSPMVGALFFPSVSGSSVILGLPHICSGSVVHSLGRNLVLTAAHCIYGSGVGYDFAPGYDKGATPYGVWSARRVFVDPAWQQSHDPQHDYAFLEMAPQRRDGQRREIEDVTGAYDLGAAPPAGTSVTVSGYRFGTHDDPVVCTARVYYTQGFPSFDCAGFSNGTSGAPWVSGGTVVGIIGGLHEGGCTAGTSYSPAFGADVLAERSSADNGGKAAFVTPAGGTGCG